MRVADQQMYGILLGNLQRSRLQLLTSQEQISSQKRVTNPSDDPSAFGQIVLDKSALSQTTQWVRNINFGTSRVNAADQALGQVQNLITRVRELTIQASSDTTSAEGRQSIAKEVRQLQRQLVQLGNTEVAGQAIFGGTKTDVQPFTITSGDTVAYQGNSETQSIAVGENQTVQILVPGSSIFTGSTTNMFDSLRDLLTALESNNRVRHSSRTGQSGFGDGANQRRAGHHRSPGQPPASHARRIGHGHLDHHKIHLGQSGCRPCHGHYPTPPPGSRRAGCQ
jgi:flagellar hook-associated protein 3 FlgL